MIKRVAGTRDILPDQVNLWQRIEEISRKIFSVYNFSEIRPPLVEEEILFNRSLGESAEIIQKQMFLIKNGSDTYALRPEGTASIVRAYLENNLDKTNAFVKLYYLGPMFRLERPQKGRFRQFHHIGCEVIGSSDPLVDVEVISLADTLLKGYGIGGYKIVVNNLGCAKDKSGLSANLRKLLKDKLGELCEDCKARYARNVLRILDCKNKGCVEVVGKLNLSDGHMCAGCLGHFTQVKQGLAALKIDFEISPTLVRGLDYYTSTVFEIKHPGLDSQQDALGAGGRYDNLVKELGGPDTGAMGFAFGLERLLLVRGEEKENPSRKPVYLISLGEAARAEGIKLLSGLRGHNISSDTDYEGKSLKGAMRKANDLGADYVLIIGDDEIRENAVTLKDMQQGTQEKIPIGEVIPRLKTKLSC